tara:strand:- start:450 stop:647 length:198 start_codon:yes stop_codon:yes gene_type:complete
LRDHFSATDVNHAVCDSIDGNIREDVGGGRVAVVVLETVGGSGERKVVGRHHRFVDTYKIKGIRF